METDQEKECVEVNTADRGWTSDMEVQSLEFAHLFFGLSLVQYFFTMSFWNGNVVVLKVYNLPFDFGFDFIRAYS